jgi:hypothetical protein
MRSFDTCGHSRQAYCRIANSRSSAGAKLTWPPSLPRVTKPSAVGITPDTPRPVPGAQHAGHRMRRRLAAADLQQVVRRRARQRHRQRREVVHDQQRRPAHRAPHLVGRELPVAVGHADQVAADRIGQREGGVADAHARWSAR